MHRNLFLLAVTALLLAPLHAADAPNPVEARLRQALKDVTARMQTAESERATLQAAQADLEAKNKELTSELGKAKKQIEDDKVKTDKSIADLNAQALKRDTEIAELKKALEEWQASQKKAADLAAVTEAKRAKFEMETIVLKRRVAEQQTKNNAMFKIGNEILARYEKFGLGEALTAREPFIGTTRVKLQNLMQDYRDNLVDQKIKP